MAAQAKSLTLKRPSFNLRETRARRAAGTTQNQL